jgi:hypothetical protein
MLEWLAKRPHIFGDTSHWLIGAQGQKITSETVSVTRVLAELGADLDDTDIHGRTPLFTAATYGHVEVIRVLSELGADVEVVDDYGETAFHSAVACEGKGATKEQLIHALARAGCPQSRAHQFCRRWPEYTDPV